MDYNTLRPQTDIDQTTDINEIAFSKLQIGQNNLKEGPLKVMDSLIYNYHQLRCQKTWQERMTVKNYQKLRESYNRKKRAMSDIREYMWDSSLKRGE